MHTQSKSKIHGFPVRLIKVQSTVGYHSPSRLAFGLLASPQTFLLTLASFSHSTTPFSHLKEKPRHESTNCHHGRMTLLIIHELY